ncbi:MAG: putative lipid II flippase FtsW [Arenicellales bacterium]|jgi:cell division protein FtsW|nr:putative lipid II flippase FtsW [Gammaproteobacteria bacterium]
MTSATLPLRLPFRSHAIDPILLLAVGGLLAFSTVMVFSAAIGTHGGVTGGFKILLRHLFSITLALALGVLTASVPLSLWRRANRWLLGLGTLLLVLVLIPGIGHEVNGSSRWLPLGVMRFQPSELIKVLVVLFLADHFVRHANAMDSFRVSIVEPTVVVGTLGALLLLEPDLGCTAVIMMTALGLMFLSGTRLRYILGAIAVAVCAVAVLILAAPYRMQRVYSFLDPWADPYGSGFQLVQALIALGSGEWFGVGLGASVQKLFYLPHASNDFLVAVIGEELGLIGLLFLLGLYAVILWRIFDLARRAALAGEFFGARLSQGIGLLIVVQALFHFAVNLGLVPTKGLTLPLMSYGGSSMLIQGLALGLIFAVQQSLSDAAVRRR